MSSEQFEKLHELYKDLYGSVRRLPPALHDSRGEERKRLLREFDEKQQEANEMLVEMEEELKYAPPAFRHQMMSKLRSYKKDLVKLQTETKVTNVEFAPKMAFDDYGYGTSSMENNAPLKTQRSLLIHGTESLNRTTDSIARSHRLAAETDAIGSDIIEELGEQREQLDRTKDRSLSSALTSSPWRMCCAPLSISTLVQITSLTRHLALLRSPDDPHLQAGRAGGFSLATNVMTSENPPNPRRVGKSPIYPDLYKFSKVK